MPPVIATACRTILATLLLTAVAYPLLVTGAAQLLFAHQARGSLAADPKGDVIGSELIAQAFRRAEYFHGRPSAAGADGWDASASGGSNLGPTSRKLRERVVAAVGRLRAENPQQSGDVPAELVTASASGLDPHLSPGAVTWQVARVAGARGVSPERVQAAVDAQTQARSLGLLGEPRVNILLLNLALDRQFGTPSPASGPESVAVGDGG